jgi:hypothetical protein
MSSQHRHTKKTKKEGHTHLQNPLTKFTELTADKTEGIRSNKSKTVHVTSSYSNPNNAINAVTFCSSLNIPTWLSIELCQGRESHKAQLLVHHKMEKLPSTNTRRRRRERDTPTLSIRPNKSETMHINFDTQIQTKQYFFQFLSDSYVL